MRERNGPTETAAVDGGEVGRQFDATSKNAAIDPGELAFACATALLHGLGPTALYEFLTELGMRRLIRNEIEALVERYVHDHEMGNG
jgi:hypothetical protein